MIDQTGKLVGPAGGLGDKPGYPPHRRRYFWLKIIGGIVVVALLYFVLRPTPPDPAKAQQGRHANNGPVPVGAAVATQGDLNVTLTALGTVTPIATVTVHTQIAGLLQQLGFTEGQMVKQGDFLAQIDPRPYQAQLEQYEGQLAKDQAALDDARLDLKRYQTLVKQDSIATQTLDTQAATVHQDEGAVKIDQAQVDTAKLNLIYCHITAPVSGRVGLRQVDLGNYVQTSDTNGIVVITELQPISVVFVLPEDNIEQVLGSMKQGGHPLVTAFDRSNTTQLATGSLETIDNQIDATTGTVKLRALFDNKDLSLFPQQFVNVTLLTSTMHNATIIPSSAVLHGAPGTFVYLVKPDNTVAVQVVKLGPVDGQNVGITDGLKPGDKVVVDGTDKLKDGAQITLPAEQKPGAPAAGGDGRKSGDGTNNTTDTTNNTTAAHHHGHHGNQTNQTNAQ